MMNAIRVSRRSGLLVAALLISATSAVAAPSLSPEEGRKVQPLLALAAEPLYEAAASPGRGAPMLSPAASALGARLLAGVPVADLLLAVAGGDVTSLSALGLEIDTVIGEVATARAVPLALVDDIARLPVVERVQAAGRMRLMNDLSVPDTGAPGVWSEYGATGEGVIVGVIDTGIDTEHPDFQNPDGTTRIKFLLDLSVPGNGPFGGTLLTAAQIDQGATARDVVGHGTHVAGSAAGGGRVMSGMRGVAPGADLIIVNGDRAGSGGLSEADVVNALSFIDQKAAELGQPYVTNLSFGGHFGAHDGSALQEVAIDNLVGSGRPGKAIVAAAGNERSLPAQHAASDYVSGVNDLRFTIPDYVPASGVQNDFVLINLWYETFAGFSITVITPNGLAVGPFAPGESNAPSGTFSEDGLILVQNVGAGANPANGDFEANILVIDIPGAQPVPGSWRIRLENGAGPFDAYISISTFEPTLPGAATAFGSFASSTGFVSEPGTARNAITVGAHTTKIEWDDKDGNHFDLRTLGLPNAAFGAIAPFSNAGPTRDGRIKPELCAPGMEIASCFSVDAPPTSPSSSFASPFPQFPNMFLLAGDRYAIQQGTSQAAPHVTGAVALLLELHPDWDIVDLKRALTTTARSDAFTGLLPNALWGYGKLDVLAAANAAASDTTIAGDIDGNGVLEITDALLALDYVLEVQQPTPEERDRTDMNRDEIIDVGDVVLVIRAIMAAGAFANPPVPPVGAVTWILPITIQAAAPVSGLELDLAPAPGGTLTPLAAAVRGARSGVLALGSPRDAEGTTRLMALAADGHSLSGGNPVINLPFVAAAGAETAAWRPLRLDLVGPGGEHVAGTVSFGAPIPDPAGGGAPASLRIWAATQNPFAGPARIAIEVPGRENRRVTVGIYDVSGRLVAMPADDTRAPGRHEIVWDGRGSRGRPLPAGVYWARVTAGGESATARLTVVR